jgi:beta-galactosidase
VDPALVARWKSYAEKGGHLILTCRTGQKDRRGFLWEGPWAMPILDLIGAKIKFYDTLPSPNVAHVKDGEQTHAWSSWGEILEPDSGTTVLARYTDQFYAGAPAAVTRPLGKGSVTYIGVDSADGELEAQLVHGVYARTGVAVEDFAPGFDVDWRDGFWVATNFTAAAQTAPVQEGKKLLVGDRIVPTAGVAVWQP